MLYDVIKLKLRVSRLERKHGKDNLLAGRPISTSLAYKRYLQLIQSYYIRAEKSSQWHKSVGHTGINKKESVLNPLSNKLCSINKLPDSLRQKYKAGLPLWEQKDYTERMADKTLEENKVKPTEDGSFITDFDT